MLKNFYSTIRYDVPKKEGNILTVDAFVLQIVRYTHTLRPYYKDRGLYLIQKVGDIVIDTVLDLSWFEGDAGFAESPIDLKNTFDSKYEEDLEYICTKMEVSANVFFAWLFEKLFA